jgi:hypothetical protein
MLAIGKTITKIGITAQWIAHANVAYVPNKPKFFIFVLKT